jgi:hypothetical protein
MDIKVLYLLCLLTLQGFVLCKFCHELPVPPPPSWYVGRFPFEEAMTEGFVNFAFFQANYIKAKVQLVKCSGMGELETLQPVHDFALYVQSPAPFQKLGHDERVQVWLLG